MNNQSTVRRLLRNKTVSLALVTVAVVALFFFLSKDGSFLKTRNLRGILNMVSVTGTVAVGMACLLISGGVDLAASSEACLGGILCAMLLRAGISWPLALFLAIIYGAVAGAINAFLANVMNIMGFIATIGMSSVYTGLAKVFTDAKFISVNDKEFQKLGSSAIFGFVPVPFVIMLALMILYGFMLRYTRFGRRSYMCGGNPQAARLSGMSPNRTTTVLYINCGALSAFAGSVLASRMHSATATAAQSVAIDAITASVLGGISFMGGSGGIAGCFVGLMLLSAFNNGLNVVQLQSYWQLVAQGALLIIALCVEFFGERARLKALKRREP